jgi:hypothetical protein
VLTLFTYVVEVYDLLMNPFVRDSLQAPMSGFVETKVRNAIQNVISHHIKGYVD